MLNTFQNFARSKLQDFLGFPGTEIYSGIITGEDHNPEWEDERAIKNVRKMTKVDSTVKGTLLAIKLPVMGAPPRMEPASDDNADILIAQFAEDNMFNNPMFAYSNWLRHALMYLEFGFELMEKAFVLQDDNKLWWNFQHRRPETVREWHADEDGDLEFIRQEALNPNSNRFERPDIFAAPRTSGGGLFHIANDQEGANFRGVSILRSAWRNYDMKDLLLRLNGMQAERYGVGILKGELKPGGDKDELIDVLQNMRAHEKMYVVETDQYKISLMDMAGKTGVDMMPAIDYHDRAINANILREFANPETKSFAKSYVEGDAFYMALDAVFGNIEDAINVGAGKMHNMKQLIDLNFSRVKKYPRLAIDRRRLQNAADFADAVQKLAGVFTNMGTDEELEDHVRQVMRWPELKNDKPVPQLIDKGIRYKVAQSNSRTSSEDFDNSVWTKTPEHKEASDVRVRMVDWLSVHGAKIATQSLKGMPSWEYDYELHKRIDDTLIPYTGFMRKALAGMLPIPREVSGRSAIDKRDRRARSFIKASVDMFSDSIRKEWENAVLEMFHKGNISVSFIRDRIDPVSIELWHKAINDIPILSVNSPNKILIAGYPDVGKTTFAEQYDRDVIHTDDYMNLDFPEVPRAILEDLKPLEEWIVEGVQSITLFRSMLKRGECLPDLVIYLRPKFEAKEKHKAMRKMLDTIWKECIELNADKDVRIEFREGLTIVKE